jgi:hypothetical protein
MPEESDVKEVLRHLLHCAHQPVVVMDRPHDQQGEPVPWERLIEGKKGNKATWKGVITFPVAPCEIPRLRLLDTLPFEQLARYESSGVRIIGFDGDLSEIDRRTLAEVLPFATIETYEWVGPKIDQAAIVFPAGHIGRGLLVGRDGKLVTYRLEDLDGTCHIELSSAEAAERLVDRVSKVQPTAYYYGENKFGRHVECHSSVKHAKRGTAVMSARSPAATGMEFEDGLRIMIIDAAAFSAKASFNLGGLSREDFERLRDEEVAMMIQKNIEQGFHCNPGMLLPIVILNADPRLREAICRLSILAEGAERAPEIAEGIEYNNLSMTQMIDLVKRWRLQGGGELPAVDPTIETNDRRGRSKKWTEDAMREDARACHADGMDWREYQNKRRPGKLFGPEFEKQLKDTIWG